jgi:hypothetical protein
LPRKGFIDGPKTTVTIQIPLYLERLIKEFVNSHASSQTEFAIEAFCTKLSVSVEGIMRKNKEAWKNGAVKEEQIA